ncbi:MAG: hypothetical protein OQJ95_05265 [Kangiella sp.]|jgi:hypothetical protein|nr:hypothetical protein [Kangiella sp.]
MRSSAIILLFVLTACSSGPTFLKPSEEYTDFASSHTYANIYLSSFFCENNRWPDSLQELKEYRLPSRYKNWIFKPVNWHDISFMEIRYIPSSVVLTAPEVKLGVPMLTSVHSEPECSNGKVVSTKYGITKN